MILDFFPQTLDMDIHGSGVADVFITPDMVQELLPGKDLVGGRGEEV